MLSDLNLGFLYRLLCSQLRSSNHDEMSCGSGCFLVTVELSRMVFFSRPPGQSGSPPCPLVDFEQSQSSYAATLIKAHLMSLRNDVRL